MALSSRLEKFDKAFMAGVISRSPLVSYASFVGSSVSFALSSLARHPPDGGLPVVLAVVEGIPEAETILDDLHALENEGGFRSLEFPPELEDDPNARAARLRVSAALGAYSIRPYPLVIVAPYAALAQGVVDAKAVEEKTIRLDVKTPGAVTFASLSERLLAGGYLRSPEVLEAGTFAVRGCVVDVWAPNTEMPVRAEFFGDDLESLRTFNAGTQISVSPIERAEFPPVEVDAEKAPKSKLMKLMPKGATYCWIDYASYCDGEERSEDAARIVWSGDPAPRGVPTSDFTVSPLPGFAELGLESAHHPELLEQQRSRLHKYLEACERKGCEISSDESLSGGFEVNDLVVVTKSDKLFAHRHRSPRGVTMTNAGERLDETSQLEPGDLVVHVDYGIGKYLGTTEVNVGTGRSEVFELEYAGGAKLYVAVAHAHLLSRYIGVKGEQVKLHRLDGKRWLREKADAQRSVMDLASRLLDTQARREVIPGFAYDLNLPGIMEFEEAFPYEETPDQRNAIAAVKRDLAMRKPMDRLLCGDAGYGKTEVAMRAAFIAAMNGKQVALLAPTTVLVEQHYETFLSRFDGTPIRIETLSRFRNEAEKRSTRARLLSGATDIVIGTHALLSERVNFHDLGLIIIDEEQRFGVKHKEALKSLRATADVLTMSATPIPRTLYLSMTGARDLSQLRTPPRERVAVETRITRDLDQTVKEAIERELARGGQVYYLYNRVATIDKAAARLMKLVPSIRLDVAHGQMRSEVLAGKMERFSKGLTDVLLCTSIIESGLDIPRANTILVDRADRFGLAELYQIRGRVGRGARQGYAYFLLPSEGLIDAEARERLAALKKHSGLGAGFNIALRDLEIRGAGNLLGHEQSGHIAAVGFQLYCQLLQRTIAKMRGDDVKDVVDVTLSLDFIDFSPGSANGDSGASLPYEYIDEESQRMAFHKRLSEVTDSKDLRKIKAELADRYGKMPPAANRLLKLAELRVRCAEAGINRLNVSGAKAIFFRIGEKTPSRAYAVAGESADMKLSSLFDIVSRVGKSK